MRRATGNVDVDRNDRVDALHDGVVVVRPAGAGAGAEGHHPFRLAHLLVHALQDRRLAMRDGADDHQEIRLPRREARQRGAEAIEVEARTGDRHVLHPAAGGHERVTEEGVLPRPLDRVEQATGREGIAERARDRHHVVVTGAPAGDEESLLFHCRRSIADVANWQR